MDVQEDRHSEKTPKPTDTYHSASCRNVVGRFDHPDATLASSATRSSTANAAEERFIYTF
jgi:hypothetical protein